MRRSSLITTMLLSAMLVSTVGCGEAAPPNVLLIVVDTLRADHVGCYGHRRDTSPAVDRLAAEGVRFERAYSTAPWTKPSVASMITGLYPSAHRANELESIAGESLLTLAEILRDRGYATGGVVSAQLLRAERGFAQGFEIYREGNAFRGVKHFSTPGVTRKAVNLLDRFSAGERPFFLFVHYFDPHYPYTGHSGIGFAGAGAGRLAGDETIHKLRFMLADLSQDELGFLRDLYDEEIRFTDRGIEQLLSHARELGLESNTLIVLTSDHGEEFRERGWLGHTRSLYEELLRVPWIFRLPDLQGPSGLPGLPGRAARGRILREPVSLVSLTPTILDLLGIDPAGFRFQGESLAGPILGETDLAPAVIFAEVDYHPGDLELLIKRTHKKAILADRFKLIRDDETGTVEVYDLEGDPGERENLAPTRPELVDRLLPMLRSALEGAAEGAVEGGVRKLSEEEVKRLRSLGYLES